MTYKKLQSNFERELLLQIITGLRCKNINKDRAKKVAQVFLPILKSNNPDLFIEALAKISYNYPEIMNAFIVAVKEYEKETVMESLEKARLQLQEALPPEALAKGGGN